VGVGLLFGFEIYRGAVVRAADAARQEGAVVAGIVPRQPALVEGILPHGDRELDRFDRLFAAEHDGLAVGLDFFAAPRPQIRVPERVGVAIGVAKRLAERVSLGLQLLAGRAPLLPGRWI